MIEFIALRAKACAYLQENGCEYKRAKGTKKCIIKYNLIFENYRESLFNSKTIIKSQQRFKSVHHKVHTEEINKIALSGNDDKLLQIFDRITTKIYGTNAFKVCESEMMSKKKDMRIKLYYNKI